MKKLIGAIFIISALAPLYPSFAVEKEIVRLGGCFIASESGSKADAKRCARSRAEANLRHGCNGKITSNIKISLTECTKEYSYLNSFLGYGCTYTASATCDGVENSDGEQVGVLDLTVTDRTVVYASGCYLTEIYSSIGKGAIEFDYTVKESIRERTNGRVETYDRIVDKTFNKIILVGKHFSDKEEELGQKLLERCNEIRSGMLGQECLKK